MSEEDPTELPEELIQEALRTPESDREPDEFERLLATPPKEGPFVADGFSDLRTALADPVLGPYLEDTSDRLHWSKGTPDEIGAEGLGRAMLCRVFAIAGHQIRSMPPMRELAAKIYDPAKRSRNSRVISSWRQRQQKHYSHYFGVLAAGATTLHGTDVLLDNIDAIWAMILKAKRKFVPADIDESDLDDFFEQVRGRAVTAAMRYDRNDPSQAKFSSYAFLFIDGAARDWRAEYFGINHKTGERYQSRSQTTSLDISVGFDGGRELTLGDITVDQSTEYHGEERPSFTEVVQSPNLTTKERDLLIGLSTHRGSYADYARKRDINESTIRSLVHRLPRHKNKF